MSPSDPDLGDTIAEEVQEDALLGTVLAGRYRLDEKLGEGGMGAVYRAEHVLMQKTVAVKVLHREMVDLNEVVKRFAREAIAAGRIEHPNVASATDFGEIDDGSYYLVLEYVPGHSLSDLLRQGGAFTEERTLGIARQVAAALAAAHEAGIVHRDLKPDNVMIVDKGGTDFVKVLDFGIAKVVAEADADSKLTQVGAVFGTPQYMSPEQAQGKKVDHRADLYCLGLLMHEMLSGARTFQCDEIAGLLVKQMIEAPPELPASISAETRQLVLELLAKDPEQRPCNAAEVVARIDARTMSLNPGARSMIGSVYDVPVPISGPVAAASSVARPLSDRELGQMLLERARQRLAEARPHVERAARRVAKFGRRRIAGRVPVWAALAAVVVSGSALALRSPSGEKAPKAATSAEQTASASKPLVEEAEAVEDDEEDTAERRTLDSPTDPELQRVVSLARQGNEPALYALSQRKEEERTTAEWLALAQGKLRRRDVPDALEAYKVALERKPGVSADKTMLGGLRYFAEKEATYRPVLEFVAKYMGQRGADLLFHVWASTSRETPHTTLAWELLQSKEVAEHMSEPLRVALELRAAETCDAVRALLPRAKKAADQRSMIRLRKLASDRGCGSDGKDDCYPCLRGDDLLKDTITQVQMNAAPQFELPRRWR